MCLSTKDHGAKNILGDLNAHFGRVFCVLQLIDWPNFIFIESRTTKKHHDNSKAVLVSGGVEMPRVIS
jgi:hypothetical protein